MANVDEKVEISNEPTLDANAQGIKNQEPEVQSLDPTHEVKLQPMSHKEEIPPQEEQLGAPADPEPLGQCQPAKPDAIETLEINACQTNKNDGEPVGLIAEEKEGDAGQEEPAYVWEYDEEYYEEAEEEQQEWGSGGEAKDGSESGDALGRYNSKREQYQIWLLSLMYQFLNFICILYPYIIFILTLYLII